MKCKTIETSVQTHWPWPSLIEDSIWSAQLTLPLGWGNNKGKYFENPIGRSRLDIKEESSASGNQKKLGNDLIRWGFELTLEMLTRVIQMQSWDPDKARFSSRLETLSPQESKCTLLTEGSIAVHWLGWGAGALGNVLVSESRGPEFYCQGSRQVKRNEANKTMPGQVSGISTPGCWSLGESSLSLSG